MLVHVEADGHDFQATALRVRKSEPWHVFLSAYGDDRWLAFMETARVSPLHFDSEAAAFFAKTSLLLGESWERCFTETAEVVAFQHRALDALGEKMRRRIERSTPQDIREWREEMESVEAGEMLRARMTGEDPLALRN
jgi:hypothetical protein